MAAAPQRKRLRHAHSLIDQNHKPLARGATDGSAKKRLPGQVPQSRNLGLELRIEKGCDRRPTIDVPHLLDKSRPGPMRSIVTGVRLRPD
jgi:hypothetical protein